MVGTTFKALTDELRCSPSVGSESNDGGRWRAVVTRAVLAVLCACGLGAAIASAATLGVARAGAPAPSKLLAIRSLSAMPVPGAGLLVTARFRGDVARELGEGRLARGGLALFLSGSGGGGAASVSGEVLDAGGGYDAVRLPESPGSGRRVIDLFGVERLRSLDRPAGRMPRAGAGVTVVRSGDEVLFLLGGKAAREVTRVRLEAFTTTPVHAGQTITATWRAVLRAHPSAVASAVVPGSSCGTLVSSQAELSGALGSAVVPELREQRAAARDLIIVLANSHARDPLAADLRRVHVELAALRERHATLGRVIARAERARQGCLAPPVSPPPPPETTVTATATATTTPPPAAPPPSVSAVSPSTGPEAGGTTVTITGSGLTGATAVRFGSENAASFTVTGDSQVTAVTPPSVTGTLDVTVTTPSGTSATGTGDEFTFTPPPVQVTQTDSGLGEEMAPQPGLELTAAPPPGEPVVNVDETSRGQTFRGLGGALTDSSAWLIDNKMSSSQRAALLEELFGAPGSASGLAAPPIHLGFLRVGVAATGAMTETPAYSYDDNPPGGSDPALSDFTTAHDTSYIIPTLQQAVQVNPGLEILASPWSPPAWMKSNGSLDNASHNGTLLDADYAPYANYLVKFIQAYAAAGIHIDDLTPANEPTAASPYPGLQLPEANEARFVAQDLEPALSAAGLTTKVYGTDESWDQFSAYASPLLTDPNAGPALPGTAWHCYFGSPTVMSELEQQAPSRDQIIDECSPEIRSFGTPEFLISTLRNWASVDAIWSIALDPSGMPIQTPNHCGGCRGAVSIDQSTGAVTFRPEYYELGQVSAFVQPGATRIASTNFVTYGTNSSNIETISAGLDDVAFLNPDGSKALVSYNTSSAPITFAVETDGRYFSDTVPAGAMTTFTWR